jgi:hypothetical protein
MLIGTEYDDVRLALRCRNWMQNNLDVTHLNPSNTEEERPQLYEARSHGNAEQPRGIGAENCVLLFLPDFLGAADIFDRLLLRKWIV